MERELKRGSKINVSDFKEPDFSRGSIEIRYESDSVCIYGNKVGLKTLSDLLLGLIDNPGQGHIHLENEYREELTEFSENTTIAIFD